MANQPGKDTTEYGQELFARMANRAKGIRAERARTLGRVVRALREREKLTRQELAERAGVSAEALMFLEQGLSDFDELRRQFVEAVSTALDQSAVILCEIGGFGLEELSIEEKDYPSRFDMPAKSPTEPA